LNFFSYFDDVFSKSYIITNSHPHPKKVQTQNCQDILKSKLGNVMLFRGFVQIPSSIGWRAMARKFSTDISASAALPKGSFNIL